jgi:ferrous iron transport protein B
VALLLKGTAFRGQPVPFVMELPNYRMPSVKNVLLLLWEKAKDFLERAFTIILLASVVIWFLQTFDYRLNVVASSADSLLALIGRGLAPIFLPLGFADWRVATSLITGLIAKEAVVSTLAVLLSTGVSQLHLALPSLFTTLSAVSFLLFTLLYTPCIAAVATINKELKSGWATLGVVIMQCAIAWIVAYAAYVIGGLFL